VRGSSKSRVGTGQDKTGGKGLEDKSLSHFEAEGCTEGQGVREGGTGGKIERTGKRQELRKQVKGGRKKQGKKK